MATDRIERTKLLRAPRQRVWHSVADVYEFGAWFGAKLEGVFVEGARMQGPSTYPGHEHLRLDMTIDRIEPERTLSWRWHPAALDPNVDYSTEPTTLVAITLVEIAGGTRVVVTESGFGALSPSRRAEAFRLNDYGWALQLESIERHLASKAA